MRAHKRKNRKIDQKVLDGYLDNAFVGFLTADEVKALSGTLRITIEELIKALLPKAAERAIVPLSGFRVGAIGRGCSGSLYFGANIEFPNLPLTTAIHAEQAVIAVAIEKGETGLRALSVSAPPCGLCRQFLNELNTAAAVSIQIADEDPIPLSELLPASFGPDHLHVGYRLMDPITQPLALSEQSTDPLTRAALETATRSHAPYSRCYAGVAMETSDGRILTGRYIENAAFNPSLQPAQTALAHLVMTGGRFHQIARVCLVQTESKIDLTGSTRELMQSVSKAPISVAWAGNS